MAERSKRETHEYNVTFIISEVAPAELPIRVGPVEILWSKLPPLTDEEKRVVQQHFGPDFREDWLTDGLAAADFRVEAADPSDAIRRTYDAANIVADLLSLRLGVSDASFDLGFDRPAKVLSGILVKRSDEPAARVYSYQRELLGYIDTDGEINRIRRTFDQETFLKLLQQVPDGLLNAQPNQIHIRLRRALHWWAESRATHVLASKFLLSWTALESLSGCPEDNWRQKGDLIKRRLTELASKHGGREFDQRVLTDLWHLRRELVHEAVTGFFDAEPAHAKKISGLLWSAQYLFLLTVIFALDSCRSNQSLFEMWSGLSTYVPSISVSPEEIPMKYMFVEWASGEERDV